jgi:hypothetical protein
MKYIGTVALSTLLLSQSMASFAAGSEDIFGVWGKVKLQGNFKSLSPDLNKFKWAVINETRTRDDSSKGSRFYQDLLFGQVGYQINNNASIWIGYVHVWTSPLDDSSFQEYRPHQDFVWNQDIGDFKFMSRSRMEQRIRETTGDTGYRARQLLKISHPLPLMNGLSVYVGDEVLFYMNENEFGKKGFSENRVFSGLSYQATKKMGVDLGYIGQYVDAISGKNTFTHNIQVNLRYNFN